MQSHTMACMQDRAMPEPPMIQPVAFCRFCDGGAYMQCTQMLPERAKWHGVGSRVLVARDTSCCEKVCVCAG
jgi:hypothetical protein